MRIFYIFNIFINRIEDYVIYKFSNNESNLGKRKFLLKS